MPFIQEVTTKENATKSLETTPTNSTKLEEPKGRSINFTIHDHNSSTQKLDHHQHKDLSDVSMDDEDEEDEMDIEDHDSLDSKRFPLNNRTLGIILFIKKVLYS